MRPMQHDAICGDGETWPNGGGSHGGLGGVFGGGGSMGGGSTGEGEGGGETGGGETGGGDAGGAFGGEIMWPTVLNMSCMSASSLAILALFAALSDLSSSTSATKSATLMLDPATRRSLASISPEHVSFSDSDVLYSRVSWVSCWPKMNLGVLPFSSMTLPPALTPTVSIKNSIAKYMCSLLGGSCGCNGGG